MPKMRKKREESVRKEIRMQGREEWANWREDLATIAIIQLISLSFSCLLFSFFFIGFDIQ